MIKGGLTCLLVYLCALEVSKGSRPAAKTARIRGMRNTFIGREKAR